MEYKNISPTASRGKSDKMYPLRNLSWYEKSDNMTLEICGLMLLLVI